MRLEGGHAAQQLVVEHEVRPAPLDGLDHIGAGRVHVLAQALQDGPGEVGHAGQIDVDARVQRGHAHSLRLRVVFDAAVRDQPQRRDEGIAGQRQADVHEGQADGRQVDDRRDLALPVLAQRLGSTWPVAGTQTRARLQQHPGQGGHDEHAAIDGHVTPD